LFAHIYGLFLKQIRDGYLSIEIFFSKLISGMITGFLLIIVQSFFFSWLIGFEEIIKPIMFVNFIYFLTLPAVISLSFIGAYISLRSSSEEVLMPILLLPMILILSIAAVTVAEDVFNTKNLDFQFYWLKLIIGMQIVFVLVCEFLFRIISKLKI
jgi:ABC-type transport system involved in cytochrome c biogenesis permease component